MEASAFRNALLTAIAPIAWGSAYYVTRHYLPADIPLTGAAIRALPAGLALLLVRPALPSGSWWWRAPVIAALTIGGFFFLVYVVSQRLPTGVAAMLMSTSALAMLGFSWLLLGTRPAVRAIAGSLAGIAGVAFLVGGGAGRLDAWGLVASVAAMGSACLGFVLGVKWRPPVPPVTFAAWQLTAGGLMLAPVAFVVEGAPPRLDGAAIGGFAYLTLVATAAAYVVWFHGLDRLGPGPVGLIGLLNPVSGTALGVGLADESLSIVQAGGAALILAGIVAGLTGKRAATTSDD